MQALDKLPLNGQKSMVAGIALIVIGIASGIVALVAPENTAGLSLVTAVEMISLGLGVLGIAHKVDKAVRGWGAGTDAAPPDK